MLAYLLNILTCLNCRTKSFTILLLLDVFCLGVCAQSWQDSYSLTLNAYSASEYKKTMEEGVKALALASSASEKLFTLKILSATCNETGDHKKGLEYGKLEIDICITEAVPDSVYINSLNSFINNYFGLQDFANAIPYQRKIIVLSLSFHESDNLVHNQYISDLGYSYLMTSEYDSAIFYLSKANKYLINIEGGAEDFLINQLNIGQAYHQKQDFILSLEVLQELQDILESNKLEGNQIYAETMENLAFVQYSLDKFEESQLAYEIASKKYVHLGFAMNDLEALNQQLALVYLKNEESLKSDSVQTLFSDNITSQNLIINQLSLGYKKYAARNFTEAKQILNKIFNRLTDSSEDAQLLAEAILLNTRLNLELYGNSDVDSVDMSIEIFSNLKQIDKEAEAQLVKSKIYQEQGLNEMAIASLNTANDVSKMIDKNYYLKYSISLDLLNIYLQLKQLSQASSLYSQIITDKLLVDSEYQDKLSYNYAIFSQINGYNLEAQNVLQSLIENAVYPELLGYQQVIAKVYLDLGQAKRSLETYNEIDQYLSGSGSHNTVEYGENLVQLGRVNVVLGEFAVADGYYIRSIELLESNSATSSRIFAAMYNSYGIFWQTIGNYEKAKLYYSNAKILAKDNLSLQVDIIQNLATLLQYEGEYYDAIILLKEAIAAYGSIYGENHPYYATALQNLAGAYYKYGDQPKAIDLLEQALRIDKVNGLENNISYTNKLHNLAIILQETNELNKAREILNIVLTNRSSLLGENHPDYIYSLYNMAVLMQKMDNSSQADKYFKQVIEKYDFQIKSFFPYLSEQEKSKYYSKIKEAFTAFQDFAVEYSSTDPSISTDLYNFQLNHKAILLNSSKSIKKFVNQSNDPELIRMHDDWIELKTRLAKYLSMSKNELELAGISIDDIVDEANTLEKKLSLKSDLFSNNLSENVKYWRDIQSKLKEDEAAVELIRIKKNIRNDSIWYVALIVTPASSVPELIVLHNGKELETRYFKFYLNSIRFKREDDQSYKIFWQPIDKALGGVKKIYLSSDGIYNKINISSIYNPDTEEYILDRMIVHNVTNTIEITEVYQPLVIDEKFSLNLIGDPYFGESGKQGFFINALPGTRIEIETIDSLARLKNLRSIKLLGAEASEDNVKKIESPNILHIATHGFFLADNTPSDDMYSMESNPLMRSGLLLSGSEKSFLGDHINFNGSLHAEDGILTAYEAMNLNLSNSDLVILSACETGLGDVKNGEGVYGLQRAFIIAGAKSILISLWKVDDNSTQELMILFYQNILNGIDKFEALNLAQKKLKEKYNLPYYWGAFVMSGI